MILESHSKIGGCASNFYRSDREFSFEAGATTISGFDSPKPLGKLLDKLQLKDQAKTKLKKLDIGMKIFYKDEIITRFSDQDRWLAENERVYKDPQIIELWKRIFKDEKLAWELLEQNEGLMPDNLGQCFKILFSKDFLLKFRGLKLLPYLFKPFSKLLNSYKIDDTDFINFINEQLMITTQNDYQRSPILSAIMGLNYPQEVYYPIGSIKNIGELILKQYEESGNEIYMRQEVESIEKLNDIYMIKTNPEKSQRSSCQENEFLTKAIISNAPIWTMKDLVKIDQYKNKIELECKKNPEAWGAFTVYFAAKIKLDLETNYLQIHAPKAIPNCKTHPNSNGSIFVTISDSKLNDRAPEGWTSFTISTHTSAHQWFNLSHDKYQEKKKQSQDFILDLLSSTIPELRHCEKSFIISGTPHSFEHYTKRKNGFVGGIAHDYQKPLIFMPQQKLSKEKIFLTGDSTFPGQGIAAVVYSAMSLVNKL